MFFVIFWTALVRYTWPSNSSRFFFRQSVLSDVFGLNAPAVWAQRCGAGGCRREATWISLFTDPGHQQGVHWRKSEDQGPWCLALAKPHFWKLGYCYSHSLVPFSCRTPGGSGWQPFTYNDYNTQLSRNFREIKFFFRELEKKTFARVSNITCTAFAIKTPYKDL